MSALHLFRLIETSEGRILIDGIAIHSIGLNVLRSRMAIIPQDPVLYSVRNFDSFIRSTRFDLTFLFQGTVRFNLDPFGTFQNQPEKLWAALDRAYLKKFIESLPDQACLILSVVLAFFFFFGPESCLLSQLDSVVAENGENFSVGQRCQMCLSRALLRESKVLIMDEVGKFFKSLFPI